MTWRGWVVFAALGIIWGLPYFFIKVAVQEVSPFALAFVRVLLAALILMPIAWRRGALRSLAQHKAPIVAFGLIEFATLVSPASPSESLSELEKDQTGAVAAVGTRGAREDHRC